MDFLEIAKNRQSCRNYSKEKQIENEKIKSILAAVQIAPSACNGQPYHITVCKGGASKKEKK